MEKDTEEAANKGMFGDVVGTLKRRGTAERITRFSSNEDNSLSSEILSEAFLTRDEVLLFLKFKKRSRL